MLDDLPPGYFVEESPHGFLALHISVADVFHKLGYGPEQDGPVVESDLAGRVALGELRAGGERFVVRRFGHGGLLRWFTRVRFSDPERPFRELIVSNALQRSGVRTPQVVAARARRMPVWGWQLELITRRVEESLDLGEALERMRVGSLSASARSALFRATGALLRELHGMGLLHADLNPRNLLVEEESLLEAQPELWVLDLDRSAFVERLSDRERRDNLRRLLRAVLRRESRGEPFLRLGDFARFFAGYDPDGERMKQDWRSVLADHKLSKVVHGAGWIVERLLRDGPERRDGRAQVQKPDTA